MLHVSNQAANDENMFLKTPSKTRAVTTPGTGKLKSKHKAYLSPGKPEKAGHGRNSKSPNRTCGDSGVSSSGWGDAGVMGDEENSDSVEEIYAYDGDDIGEMNLAEEKFYR